MAGRAGSVTTDRLLSPRDLRAPLEVGKMSFLLWRGVNNAGKNQAWGGGRRGERGRIGDQRTFLRPACPPEGLRAGSGKGEPKSQGWRKRRDETRVWPRCVVPRWVSGDKQFS